MISPTTEQLLSPNYATVFDVGGSVGNFAEWAWRRWPAARIFSFEPLRDVAATNEIRSGGRWQVVRAGMREVEATARFHRNLASSEASSILGPSKARFEAFGLNESYQAEDVDFLTLDSFASWIREPALLKIDVEGAEHLTIAGGRSVIPRFELVIVELNARENWPGCLDQTEIVAMMGKLGFYVVTRENELRHPISGQLLQCDGVFKRANDPIPPYIGPRL